MPKKNGHQLQETITESLRLIFEQIKNSPDPSGLHQLVVGLAEEPLLRETLAYTEGNCSRAARILGISRSTLQSKMDQYKIKVKVKKKVKKQ